MPMRMAIWASGIAAAARARRADPADPAPVLFDRASALTMRPRVRSIRRAAIQSSALLLDLIDSHTKAGAIDPFAVRKPEREDVQRAADHRVIGHQLGVHHGCLHMRAAALYTT